MTPGQHSHRCSRKPEIGLPTGLVTAYAGRVIKTVAAIGSYKLAHRDRHTIHDRYCGVIKQKRVADETPQPLFHGQQVGSLPQPGGANHSRHCRKEMRVVATEVIKDFLILGESQIGFYQFHCNDQAHGQLGHRPSFAQAFALRRCGQHLVNQTETCDNTIGLLSWCPSSKDWQIV
jgi:hypothetical protein